MEAEAGGTQAQGQPGHLRGIMPQIYNLVVKHLPSIYKTLGSSPSTEISK